MEWVRQVCGYGQLRLLAERRGPRRNSDKQRRDGEPCKAGSAMQICNTYPKKETYANTELVCAGLLLPDYGVANNLVPPQTVLRFWC